MALVLVSGAEEQVERLAGALRGRGADVTEVTDLEDMPKVFADAGTAVYDAYVPLPSTFQMRGETVVDRVQHFYANGVLARYPALGAALPALKPGARITFVLGQLPPEVGSPDDRTARKSLTRILSQAASADATEASFAMQILDSDASIDTVAASALGQGSASQALLSRLSDLDYADWRVEVLGLAAIET